MKLLLVGGGGREHALAWKLKRDDPSADVIAAPGNPGIAELGRCVPIAATDVDRLLACAQAEQVDLTVVGPEAPLAEGIVDRFREHRLPIFGPTARAAEIETSKSFAKELMFRASVPTAAATRHTDAAAAREAARRIGAPVVIKATGLAAGKGVVVCGSMDAADAAIEMMLLDNAFGSAGSEVLVEEFMSGEELSLFVLTDGEAVLPMLPAQDHKRLLEGDRGPNTGGMGSYAPVTIGAPALVEQALERIVLPTLAALRSGGRTFTGLLYAGLMITDSGPKVVEFNCRFGDPETETLLPLLDSSLLEPVLAIAGGGGLGRVPQLHWLPRYSATTVVAAHDYPESPRKGDRIVLPAGAPDVIVFHAGTARDAAGELVTAGGRVLAVTALGDTLAQAQERSTRHAGEIAFDGMHFRRDIGWRELSRHARAT